MYYSTAMLKKMDQRVAANDSDDLILQSFVQEYGEQVLAEPPASGFNMLAWMIPGIAFGLAWHWWPWWFATGATVPRRRLPRVRRSPPNFSSAHAGKLTGKRKIDMALIALLPDGDMLALLGCIALTRQR